MMQIRADAQTILAAIEREHPGAVRAVQAANGRIAKRQILDWQAAALYALAKPYDRGCILEIGTLAGYSASVLAMAAPRATITTLNPSRPEAEVARANLRHYPNVAVVERRSWDFLDQDGSEYDLIWVDGDHNQIARDLPWFNRLKVGGLVLCHDYSPEACPPVYRAVNGMAGGLHGMDVLLMDEFLIGMAGIYRRAGETW